MRHFFVKVMSPAALAVLWLVPAPAFASLALAMELPELAERADRVVIAQVAAVTTEWDSTHSTIVSRVELAVEETLKGDVPANRRLRLVQVGGQVGELVMRVSGQPGFVVGERAVLFLEGPAGNCHLVGLGQGKRPLRFDPAGGRWMAQPGDGSAAVRPGPGGELQHVGSDGPRTLSDLRSLVQAVARRQLTAVPQEARR
jgi:hypothetical protein